MQQSDQYRLVMLPAMIMGVFTNAYILLVLILIGAFDFIYSPIAGGLIFALCFYGLLKNKNSKATFFIGAITCTAEIYIHTLLLGWDSGFFYFLFLLPAVFLLNTNWKKVVILIYLVANTSAFVALYFLFLDQDSFFGITEIQLFWTNLCNASCAGLVMLVIILYFSQKVGKKEKELIIANNILANQNTEISKQSDRQRILLKEIHHRVKNNLQIISSLISLQRENISDEKAIRALDESKSRIMAIALIHAKLYQDEKIHRVDFKSYLEELVISQKSMNSVVSYDLDLVQLKLNLDTAVPLGLIISELVSNSFKHAFKDHKEPKIELILKNLGDLNYVITIKDNGIGLPEHFDIDNPSSLGTEIIQALTGQIQARPEHTNENGAIFSIYFKDSNEPSTATT
jgi:two-component sensor histidine kinase